MVFIDDKFIGLPFINRTVTMVIRSSHRRCSVKKAAPNNFGIFTNYENICKQFLLVIHYYNKINLQSFQLQIKRFFSVNIDNIMALY